MIHKEQHAKSLPWEEKAGSIRFEEYLLYGLIFSWLFILFLKYLGANSDIWIIVFPLAFLPSDAWKKFRIASLIATELIDTNSKASTIVSLFGVMVVFSIQMTIFLVAAYFFYPYIK